MKGKEKKINADKIYYDFNTADYYFFSPFLKPFLAAGGPPASGSLHTLTLYVLRDHA